MWFQNWKLWLLGSLAGFGAMPALAQEQAPVHTQQDDIQQPDSQQGESWASRGSDIPFDAAWRMGELANGLRYAVRQNAQPENAISVRISVGLGGLAEADHQQGWSHLIEHLVFRGRDAQGNDLQQQLEQLGAVTRTGHNAFTNLTHTVYHYELSSSAPDTYSAAIGLLAQLLRNPALDEDVLVNEKQIVLAERAQRLPAPVDQIEAASRELFLAGLTASRRNVIGTAQTIGAAQTAGLQALYQAWYRPDNVQVVIVGDADVAVLEQGARAAFSDWAAPASDVPEIETGSLAGNAGDAVAVIHPQAPLSLQLSWARDHQEDIFTQERQQRQYLELIAASVLGQRLAGEAIKGEAIVNAAAGFVEAPASADQLIVQLVPREGQWQEALAQAFGVINALSQTPPTQAEIDQQAAGLRGRLEQALVAADTRTSPQLADSFVRNVNAGDISGDRQFYLDLFDGLRAALTPQTVGQSLQQLLAPGARMLVVGPQPLDGGQDAPRLALQQAMQSVAVARQESGPVSLDQIALPPEPGAVADRAIIQDLGIERVTFANGLELVMKQTPFEQGVTRLQLITGHGVLDREVGDAGMYWSAGALGAMGIGPLGPEDLGRLGAGRQIGFGFQPSPDSLRLISQTNRNDLADALRLLTGAVSQPSLNAPQFERYKAQLGASYNSLLASPAAVFQVFSPEILHGGDARFAAVPDMAELQAKTFADFEAFWTRQLGAGPRKLIAVGDFDREALVAAVGASLGALPAPAITQPDAALRDVVLHAPEGGSVTLAHRGDPSQALLARVYPTTGVLEEVELGFTLRVAAELLSAELFEGFRAEQGGTYTPFANSVQSLFLPRHGYVLAGAPVSLDREAELAAAIDDIVARLAEEGPEEQALARAKQNLRVRSEQLLNGNTYWQIALTYDLDQPNALEILRQTLSGIDGVDAQDVRAAMQRFFAGRGFDLRVVNPEAGPAQ